MRHPITVTCDFCKGPIDLAKPFTTIEAVVPADIAKEVHERWIEEAKAQPQITTMFGQMGWRVPTPTHHRVDMCGACERMHLPELQAMVALMVTLAMEKQREAAQQPDHEPKFKDDD